MLAAGIDSHITFIAAGKKINTIAILIKSDYK